MGRYDDEYDWDDLSDDIRRQKRVLLRIVLGAAIVLAGFVIGWTI